MTMSFEDRTAIVTGAGRGMGRAHARLLAERGANVVVNDLGGSAEGEGADAGPAEGVAEEIREAGGNAVANKDSVADPEGARAMVQTAVDTFGGVDIVVNNAGILTAHEVPESGLDDLEKELAVHLVGSFNVTRAAWPHLCEHGRGRVVCTTSCGVLGSPVLLSYGAAKGGIIGMVRSLAVCGDDDGVKVNMVAPYALTRMADPDLPVNRAARSEVADPGDAAVFARLQPELVSSIVGYLAHESCELNGEILSGGGGLVARMFIGETRGFADTDLTPEQVGEHLDEIMDTTDFLIPGDVTDYTNKFVKRVPMPSAG